MKKLMLKVIINIHYSDFNRTLQGMINEKIKWNFTKFLIDREGNVIKRFSPQKKPEQIKSEIEKLLS